MQETASRRWCTSLNSTLYKPNKGLNNLHVWDSSGLNVSFEAAPSRKCLSDVDTQELWSFPLHCKLVSNHVNIILKHSLHSCLLTVFFVLCINQHTHCHCMSQASKTIPVIYQRKDSLYLLWHIYKYVSFYLNEAWI